MYAPIDMDTRELLNTDDLRDEWVEVLSEPDYKFHLTLTFPKNTPESETRKLLNLLIRHLNRNILNRSYKRGKKFISGFAIQESTPAMSTNHFHVLIIDEEWMPDREKMHQLIHKQVQLFNGNRLRIDRSWKTQARKQYTASKIEDEMLRKVALRPKREIRKRHKLNRIENWKLQDYYNHGGFDLQKYVTKSFEKMPFQKALKSEFIGILTSDAVSFGV